MTTLGSWLSALRTGRALRGLVLLGVLLLLNLAAVLPAVHALWHGDEGCESADCAVAAFATGSVDASEGPVAVVRTVALVVDMELGVGTGWVPVSGDCPALPGRAPPVSV